jgi:hypothetical protein
MQRREFIGGILWPTLFGRLGFAEGTDKTLLALAQVVIPDRDSEVWKSGEVALAMVDEFENLRSAERDLIATTLKSLNEAANSQGSTDFQALSLRARTKLVKKQIELSAEVKQGFTMVRAAALKFFYGSSVGHKRTGYRETNQFEGYPEHVQTAETWE